MDPNSEPASDVREIRHGLVISRRERNWLKRHYGSITKGMYAVLVHAMSMSVPPPPVYNPKPRNPVKPRPVRQREAEQANHGKKVLDLSAAIEALQNQPGQGPHDGD